MAWGSETIGGLVESWEPILRVTVIPAEKRVYVDHLPPDTELPPELSDPPYGKRSHNREQGYPARVAGSASQGYTGMAVVSIPTGRVGERKAGE
jgi:hypothetical protein